MATFNTTLSSNEVVVAIDHKYNDNDGAYSIAWVWNGETLRSECYANGYNNGNFNDAEVNASKEQVAEAAEFYATNKMYNGQYKYIGDIVVLKRSRKAPNKVALLVVDHKDSYYDSYYNRRVDAQICVNVEGSQVWVSTGCVDQVVKGSYPWWKA